MFNKALGYVLIFMVRAYQYTISPLLGPTCRFTPSCSYYMVESINEWGAFKGLWLGLKRIGKCHPWGSSGYDPVPKKSDKKVE